MAMYGITLEELHANVAAEGATVNALPRSAHTEGGARHGFAKIPLQKPDAYARSKRLLVKTKVKATPAAVATAPNSVLKEPSAASAKAVLTPRQGAASAKAVLTPR
jgi:hypothetical protein